MIRRLSRVASCPRYEALRKLGKGRRRGVAQGHVPVYVGEEMERFEVRAELLSRPVFVELLRLAAEEYGYHQCGALRIPCPVPLFRRLLLLAASSDGAAEREEAEILLRSFDVLFLSSVDGPS
ncbi:unnamed protein product [Musa acuminata subsp. burmannicoides]|uniref:(wild Malaysian banana) hypothetical protein n=1 Tax=Musa acuminata subsp. malaccensis TaxID=214687 RepID=A0A804IVC1_MUSAM|nr:unnamed protein product [Musa acuminata subsp. malaccensis]